MYCNYFACVCKELTYNDCIYCRFKKIVKFLKLRSSECNIFGFGKIEQDPGINVIGVLRGGPRGPCPPPP